MTVKELIQKLSLYEDDLEIRGFYYDTHEEMYDYSFEIEVQFVDDRSESEEPFVLVH